MIDSVEIEVGNEVVVMYGPSAGTRGQVTSIDYNKRDMSFDLVGINCKGGGYKKFFRKKLHKVVELKEGDSFTISEAALEKYNEKKEDTKMYLFRVTAVVNTKDSEFEVSTKKVVAVDEDSAKMKSGLMVGVEGREDYTTINVEKLFPVKSEK